MQQLQPEVQELFGAVAPNLLHPVLVEDRHKELRHWRSDGDDLIQLEAWDAMHTDTMSDTLVSGTPDEITTTYPHTYLVNIFCQSLRGSTMEWKNAVPSDREEMMARVFSLVGDHWNCM